MFRYDFRKNAEASGQCLQSEHPLQFKAKQPHPRAPGDPPVNTEMATFKLSYASKSAHCGRFGGYHLGGILLLAYTSQLGFNEGYETTILAVAKSMCQGGLIQPSSHHTTTTFQWKFPR